MIIFENVKKRYEDIVVFDNLNLSLLDHKINCVMGYSGRGKTTLIRLLMKLEKFDSGTIIGLENLKISAVFQEDRLCENLDVYTNILLPHIYKESYTKITKAKIDQGLASIGLAGLGNKKVNTLSGGMKRRVAILRAMYMDFDLLILDEAFKGLDDEVKLKTIEFVKSESKNKTIIYITHDKVEAEIMDPDIYIDL